MEKQFYWADGLITIGETINISRGLRDLEPTIFGKTATVIDISSSPTKFAQGNIGPKPIYDVVIVDQEGKEFTFSSFILAKMVYKMEEEDNIQEE